MGKLATSTSLRAVLSLPWAWAAELSRITYPPAEPEAAGGTGPAPRQPELGSIQANAHGSGSQGQFHNCNQ